MNINRIISIVAVMALSATALRAQSVTFAVDEVEPTDRHVGMVRTGHELATSIHLPLERAMDPRNKVKILANSFAQTPDLHNIGEDVLFKMLRMAWCQHRPVVLTPDAVWMVIAQGLSHHVNSNPEELRGSLVAHEGRKELCIRTETDLFSEQARWDSLIGGFVAGIDKYTNGGIAGTLVADFSTTGVNERIASEITLMDAVKPYFDYTAIYVVCGIPSITLTGTPDDWRKVLEKTRALSAYGLGWWQSELEPILQQFISASEGKPDVSFWRNIVMTTRPDEVRGPSCSGKQPELTRFDGWFLKLFPFDNNGRTPDTVVLSSSVLPETVSVPLKYEVVGADASAVLQTFDLELVAGIVGVQEDPVTFALTPKIGWFVRMGE